MFPDILGTESELVSADSNMQWTVQIIVLLLNIVWIVFFLQPDPFSVFVQRRSSDSSDEEILLGEFCIQIPSEIHSVTINNTNNTNTTSEGSRESNLTLHEIHSMNKTKAPQDCQCNKTNVHQSDLDLSQLSHIKLRPPAPGCEPKIIMTFPNTEVCIDVEVYFSAIAPLVLDWDGTTPAGPPVLGNTPSEVNTTSVGVTATRQSKAPVQEEDNPYQTRPSGHGLSAMCCFAVSNRRIPLRAVKEYITQQRSPMCPVDAIILVTVKGRSFCVDPGAQWVRELVISLNNERKSRR